MTKNAFFVFNGDPMCFIHVLLNALDMHAKSVHCRIVVEGAATKLVPELAQDTHPLHQLWEKAKSAELIAGVCKACAKKMGTLEAAVEQNLTCLDDMHGHPSMAVFQDDGYTIITF